MPYEVGHATNAYAIATEIHQFQKSNTPEARETADLYIKAAERLMGDSEVNVLAPWDKPEYSYEKGSL